MRFIKKIMNYVPAVVIPTICTLIITVMNGNYLNPKEYGEFSIFSTTLNIVNVSIFSFITLSVMRFYNRYKDEGKEIDYIGTNYMSIFILSTILLVIGLLLKIDNIEIFILSLVAITTFSLSCNLLRAQERIIVFNIFRILGSIFTVTIAINFILKDKFNKSTLILAMYLPQLIFSVVLITIYYLKKNLKITINTEITKQTIKYGGPLVVSGLLNLILSSSDRYMINYFLDSSSVGMYSFGYKIAELTVINITSILLMALYPQIIKAYDEFGRSEAEKSLNKYINIHFIIIIPIIFLIYIFMKDIINIIFPKYIGAEYITIFTVLGTLFYSLGFYTNKAFELTQNTAKMVRVLIVAAIVNVILNILLIPYFKIMGAVIATILSYIVYIVVAKIVSRKYLNIKFNYKNISYIILLCISILSMNLLINFHYIENIFMEIIVRICLFLIIYIIGIYTMIKLKLMKI